MFKVVQTVLVDAAGVASLLTMNEACVVEAPDEDKPVGVQSHRNFLKYSTSSDVIYI